MRFSSVVADAMADCEKPLRLRVSAKAHEFTVSLLDRGVPLDALYAARDPRWSRVLAGADSAAWHWLGNKGTELLLTFRFSAPQQPLRAAPGLPAQSVEPAPQQSYVIRAFLPGDAHGVARCFYATYGLAYDFPAVYEPRRLTELNERKMYQSFVALDQSGEVIAHYALRCDAGAAIVEGCGAVVDPRHRGRGLLERLRLAAEEHAKMTGFDAYYTEPVTDHLITQNESEKFGARITAISLGHSPQSMIPKGMEGLTGTSQRQSLTLYVKPLRAPQPRTLAAPPKHRAMLERIYAEIGIPIETQEQTTIARRSGLNVSIDKALQSATITFEGAGGATLAAAPQAAADLAALRSLAVIYAMLPLDDPDTPQLCAVLEETGFFFSGLGPWMLDGRDALRLQRLFAGIDTTKLAIASPFGKELLAYIEAQRSLL